VPQRILIVDDSPAMQSVVARSVKMSGLTFDEFLFAGDGRQALDILGKSPADLVLADINMPTMDGEEFVRTLLADPSLRSVPVVVVSTDATNERVLMMLSLGAKGYVKKPFTPEGLGDEMRRVLEIVQ